MKLLVLSNGHGEDEVAVRVLRQLQTLCPHWDLKALPLVGEGKAYEKAGIARYGPVQAALPSGGFIYMSQRELLRDLNAGLLDLTWQQLRDVRYWAKTGGAILAVGDIVPLLFAWWSGLPYAFIGTAKSEYYLRQDDVVLKATHRWPWQGWLDCVYLPWERWLMSRSRCVGVFPRDGLTCRFLQQWPIPVFDFGNPMMDDLDPKGILTPDRLPVHINTVLLLPGSRIPEVYRNWYLCLSGIGPLALRDEPMLFIAAIASLVDFEPLQQQATALGWTVQPQGLELPVPHCWLTLQGSHLLLVKEAFSDALHWSKIAIATTGTAAEQCVGLGKPVVTIAGDGPQFTWAFAEAQSRLLGPSVQLQTQIDAIAPAVLDLMSSSCQPLFYQENGHQRMGTQGASFRIAQQLQRQFQASVN